MYEKCWETTINECVTRLKMSGLDSLECVIYSTYFPFVKRMIHAFGIFYLLYLNRFAFLANMLHKDLLWIGNTKYAEDNDQCVNGVCAKSKKGSECNSKDYILHLPMSEFTYNIAYLTASMYQTIYRIIYVYRAYNSLNRSKLLLHSLCFILDVKKCND